MVHRVSLCVHILAYRPAPGRAPAKPRFQRYRHRMTTLTVYNEIYGQ